MRQGYLVVIAGWDFSAPCAAPPNCGPDKASGNFTTTLPVAKNPDGTSILGLNTEELVVDTGASPTTLPLTYPASTLDKSQASLTVRHLYADTPTPILASGWEYTSAAGTAIKLVPGPFVPTNLYEFTYPAKDPVVAGLGFAAIRDLATFLRDADQDESDPPTPNPLAGQVDLMYSICSSQPCRTMRDFVFLGFNEADSGPLPVHHGHPTGNGIQKQVEHVQVFDGVLNWKAGGSGIFLNYRFSQPVRTHRQHIARWTPEIQFPFANETIVDHVTKQKGGRLERCKTTKTCPKIVEANSANEFWAKAASNLLTDAKGHDLHLDEPNVAYYLQSSAPHGAASGKGICEYPRNPLAPDQLLRGLLVVLDQWVTSGIQPPDNRIPRVKDGTLVPTLPQAGQGFPNIPGITYNGINHTGDLFDFGSRFDQGIMDILPPTLLGTPYPALVPKTDTDGNDIAGVRMPEIAVPTATYTGWNLRAAFAADLAHADGCDASGLKTDFPATQDDRVTTGDPRLSIKERYPTHQAYVDAVTAAANALRDDRFLIQEDVDAYISAAQASSIGN
jgi:alpha/beta hydrolase family protein